MKTIETRYNNILFRSRTEARWAYYFDLLKLKWAYEVEGFVLDDGRKYLPDFYFPVQNLYAEVKPRQIIDSKWDLFVKGLHNDKLNAESGLILLVGNPHHKNNKVLSCSGGLCDMVFVTDDDDSCLPNMYINTGYEINECDDFTRMKKYTDIVNSHRFYDI